MGTGVTLEDLEAFYRVGGVVGVERVRSIGQRRRRHHMLKWDLVGRASVPAAGGYVECPSCRDSEGVANRRWHCALCGAAVVVFDRTRIKVLTPDPPGCSVEVAAAYRLGGMQAASELRGRVEELVGWDQQVELYGV